MLYSEKVQAAAERANNRRGYGSIRSFRLFLDGRIEAVISRPFMHDTKRTGRIRDGRVYFVGTSAKIEN